MYMYWRMHSRIPVFLPMLMLVALMWIPDSRAASNGIEPYEKSDLNKDSVVDSNDLKLFADKYLLRASTEVDWCGFHDAVLAGIDFAGQPQKGESNSDKLMTGQSAEFYQKHFRLLLTFINEESACDQDWEHNPDILSLENNPRLLLRIAESTDGSGEFYITDPLVGSLFIYDAGLFPVAELKYLDKPLGVAVDSQGYLLVGNDGRDNVEVYDPYSGHLLAIFGLGRIIMPNSITSGPDGNIYVTDSRSHRVWVFDADYNFVRSIGSPGEGENELYFPVDTAIINRDFGDITVQEVFVADQGNERIQIYDTDGYLLRHIYPGECGMSGCLPPLLANLQALDVDELGRLHVLDNFEAVVSILDPVTGEYLGEYGEYGEGPGYLRVPYGLVVTETGEAIVTSGDGHRVVVYPPQ